MLMHTVIVLSYHKGMHVFIIILRFGSFEICKTQDAMTGRTGPSVGNIDILSQLVDYTIKHFYPEVSLEKLYCISSCI